MSISVMTNERLVELLVQRATEGLSAAEQIELNRLLAQDTYHDVEMFEKTAAALTLAALDDEPLPASLTARLEQQADAFAASSDRGHGSVTPLTPRPAATTKASPSGRVGWFAAAACAVLAIAGWWPRIQDGEFESVQPITHERERLLAQGTALQRDWKPTEDPAGRGVTGDVVWDPQAQKGYMRFRGLPSNDPQQMQYQVWIFDATRGDQYPVDGGVFNIPQDGGEVIVPILAKLPVRDPALFAVTIEKPGGAVVSMRERIVVVAPVAAG